MRLVTYAAPLKGMGMRPEKHGNETVLALPCIQYTDEG